MKRLPATLIFLTLSVLDTSAVSAIAETIRVPQDHNTIQSAVDAASSGDLVLVTPGRYRERIKLKPGIVLRSAGNDDLGDSGLARAENTIVDGGGLQGKQPGVLMAEDSTLDGFTITNVGLYDPVRWQKHFETQGEQLDDDTGSVQVEGTIPAVSIRAVNCTVKNNLVHRNGDAGIAIVGKQDSRVTPLITKNTCSLNMGGGIGVAESATPIIRENTCKQNLRAGIGCRNSSPHILNNSCFENVRAGIGCREGSRPLIRDNKCYRNRRAGIGIRMEGTSPIVEHNACFENAMAGIGNRDKATPIIRGNQCVKNQMAGIGCDGSDSLLVGNECRENGMAGIGVQGKAKATIQNNRCIENKLVAIGVTQRSEATIVGNTLTRLGGVPPIVAIKDGSTVTMQHNEIRGGGVAAALVQGKALISKNTFYAAKEDQGNAIWIWKHSKVEVNSNAFEGYATAVNASDAEVLVTANSIRRFKSPAILIRNSSKPPLVAGNEAFSADEDATITNIQGLQGTVTNNTLHPEEESETETGEK